MIIYLYIYIYNTLLDIYTFLNLQFMMIFVIIYLPYLL